MSATKRAVSSAKAGVHPGAAGVSSEVAPSLVTGKPIELELRGQDLEQLRTAAAWLRKSSELKMVFSTARRFPLGLLFSHASMH